MRLIALLMLGLVVSISGCVTGVVNKEYSKVDYSKPITAEEAKVIAQKYCIDHTQICKGYYLNTAQVDDICLRTDDWKKCTVSFDGDLDHFLTRLYLQVDRQSGKVLRNDELF